MEPREEAVFVHRAGSAEPRPADWPRLLADALRRMPGVVLVGAKRVAGDGTVFAMGEMVVHPKGFHHVGRGTPAAAYRFPEEVDVVAGGVCAVAREPFEEAGGEAALAAGPAGASGAGDLALLELGLRLRRSGRRCVAVPQVVVEDAWTPDPTKRETAEFQRRWGFDWRAADLRAVRERHAGTALLWQVRYHAEAMPFEKYAERPAVHWTNYQQVEVYRQRADHLAKLVGGLCPPGGRVLDLGCGDGLFSHLFAQGGASVLGIDPEPIAIEQATQRVRGLAQPGAPPRFEVGGGESLGCADGSVDVVAMLDVIEHLPNPVAVLREAARVLCAGGHLLISTPCWRYGAWSDPVYHVCEYTMEELVAQVRAATGMSIVNTGMIKGVYRDLIVIARKDVV